jgi:hypothetical protein
MRRSHIAIVAATTATAAASGITTTALTQGTARSQITATLQAAGRPSAFEVFGTELSFGHYRVAARLPRVPCSGLYRFEAVGANLADGTTSDYVADVRLKQLKVKGAALKCGSALPARFGRGGAKVELVGIGETNRDRRITLGGTRVDDGSFAGTMDIASILCRGPYRFLAAFRDREGHRIQISYRFSLKHPMVDGQELAPCP